MHSLVVAKFVPGLSMIAPPLAGIVGLSVPLFLLYNTLGTVIWVGSGIGLGYLFAGQLQQALSLAVRLGPMVALILLGIVIGYVLYKTLHRLRADRVVARLTVEQLSQKIATGEAPLIIDLRPHKARQAAAGIPGALSLSYEELIARHHDLPRDRDVILYCACPHDAASVQAAWSLRKNGLTRAWPLVGGIEAWRAHQSLQTASEQLLVDTETAAA
jgi:rhodanese-related sulfurtransferase